MGAGQSSNHSDAAGATQQPQKTCYYDLLGVERQATDDEQVSYFSTHATAYRRKALELHPDRNLNDVESATKRFAEIQSAYEVLSDPQERAWYDSHRDAILNGLDGQPEGTEPPTFRNVRLTSTEEIMGLIRKFNATVPFTDEPNGFFGIARETFEHLALEEEAAAEFDGVDCVDYPTFGSSDDGYEDVVRPFYACWASFSTTKSFSWKDKYRLSDAPDRRIRRLMEKENRKCRDDAVREFNDAVRFLVTFVRKRDTRYIPNSQSEAERQKSLRDAAAAQAARSRAANQEKLAAFEVPDWAQSKDTDPLSDQFSLSEEESEVEVLECVVCNKTFKSEKQLEAHERSKKHVKAVQQLRRQMKKEGTELDLELEEPTEAGQEALQESPPASSGLAKPSTDVPAESDTKKSADSTEEPDSGRSSRSSTQALDSDDYAPRSAVEERILSNPPSETKPDSFSDAIHNALSDSTQDLTLEDIAPKKKVGKAKAKREKKAAALRTQENDVVCIAILVHSKISIDVRSIVVLSVMRHSLQDPNFLLTSVMKTMQRQW
ncbi:DnaJ subfamily C member [Paramyrothecium foliicola]|nr:DnaJ subfamily C member [Paramyrothecium foliicola]